MRKDDTDLIGLMVNDKEHSELNYILKTTMDEILYDLSDKRLDENIEEAVKIRYKRVYGIFSRIATNEDKRKYIEQFNKNIKGK